MKVIKAAEGETLERTGEAVFEPGAQVWGRETSSPETSKDFTSGIVSFAAGAVRRYTRTPATSCSTSSPASAKSAPPTTSTSSLRATS